MRKMNVECIICKKEMYRRPFEIKQARYFACLEHREIAKGMFPITDKQKQSLVLGRGRSDNGLTGTTKSEKTKKQISDSHKKYHEENPDFALMR